MQPSPPQDWWTPKDLARRWGCNEKTVRRKITAGFIVSRKLPGSDRHLVAWVEIVKIETRDKAG
jgi:AraC-like DNA-binding protein